MTDKPIVTDEPGVARARRPRGTGHRARTVVIVAAIGVIIGGTAGFVAPPLAGDAWPKPRASATPLATVDTAPIDTAAPTVAPTESVAGAAPGDVRYPTAPHLDATTLAAVGDLWRLESVTTFRDDPAPGPTVVYLVSPEGDRYRAGMVPTQGRAVLAWDVAGDAALVGGPGVQGGFSWFRLDLATGAVRADTPPAPLAYGGATRMGVGSDGRTFFNLGNEPFDTAGHTGVWAWSAGGWERFGLAGPSDPYAFSDTDAIVEGGNWMLWTENAHTSASVTHLVDLTSGADQALVSIGEGCWTDGWYDRTHLDAWCSPNSDGQGGHRAYDVATGALSDAPDSSNPTDGYVYSSAQLPGTPLVFRFDDTPGFVSSISVLTEDGLKNLATVAPEDQFQIGDVIEVRPGTYVIRDGVGYTPGDEVVRAVIDAVAGFAAFGSPSDPYWEGELPDMRTSILVNVEGE